ncbi:MAG: hypothetical protein NT049_05265 [Planctomycetota bacterium]|nr:hypothetical protein [Planctomycetota bacterium]
MFSYVRMFVCAGLLLALAPAGCAPKAREAPGPGPDALGPLDPQALRTAYNTPGFVMRTVKDGRPVAVQDTEIPAGTVIDDTNLVIFVEGSGDSVDVFRWTARLLAESPHGFPEAPERLVIILVHWSETRDVVAEHLSRDSQLVGAARLHQMLETHRLRHGDAGHAGVIGFSAGTRVMQFAYTGTLAPGAPAYPEGLRHADNLVFLGSSISREDPMPVESIRGRFINFVNPRDTHYGDRAPYVAPAGQKVRPLEFLVEHTLVPRPHFGVSVEGFTRAPTLTNEAQFDAILAPTGGHDRHALDLAFRTVNVPVPDQLVPKTLLGQPILNDDMDDYFNQAPNHYIMVGRGPANRLDGPDFALYRAAAGQFVREHVGAAVMHGRLYRSDLGLPADGKK